MFHIVVRILLLVCSGSITLVGEERANSSSIVNLFLCSFCLEGFPLPLGAWDRLPILLWLPVPSIYSIISAN